MVFLYAAAWDDYKTGAVDLQLLLTSVFSTLVLKISIALSQDGIDLGLAQEQAPAILAVLVPFYILFLRKKLGAADIVIFNQTAILFGPIMLIKITALASASGLIWAAANAAKKSTSPVTLKALSGYSTLWKQEIRFIPFIAFGAQAVFVTEFLKDSFFV